MSVRETAIVFEIDGDRCVGIVSHPDPALARDCGVLILVGGPQYRVGSHRQFALLARALAAQGYPALRFDFRGMGDSEGDPVDFAATADDIAAALDAFQRTCPELKRIVLWGLCDAASAALIYAGDVPDPRLAGLCLINPWVRSEVSEARARVRYYYLSRLRDPDFWRKLRRGRLQLGTVLADLWGNLRRARRGATHNAVLPMTFQARMARGFSGFDGPILLILSGRDQVAHEFADALNVDPAWRQAASRGNVSRVDLPEADHTCSSFLWRRSVEDSLSNWLRKS